MKSSHCEDKQEDRPLDILTDEDNGLRIIVSRLSGPDQSCENKSSRPMDRLSRLVWEPCWGLTDHHEQRAYEAFEDKEGIQTISSAGELRASLTMILQLASCD